MITLHTLKNGIRVIMEPMEQFRSVAIGVWVNTGSVREGTDEAGASHFIEHMVFKGTERRSTEQIAIEMDAIGGNLNAFTSKECTCFYAKVLDEQLPQTVDLLSDIVLHSTFDETELKKESGVIIEEILMTEDTPEDLAAEENTALFYGGDPLGRPILGTKASVSSFTREKLLNYRSKHYIPKNIVISCAGSFAREKLIEMLEAAFDLADDPREAEPLENAFPGGKRVRFIEKDIEQMNISMTLPGFARRDQYPLAVLSNIIGGGTSSRLFQKIREQRGLAYSIYSYPISYTSSGTFSIYAGTGEQQAVEVTELILEELSEIRRNGIREDELIRCREQLKSAYLLGVEGTSAQMNVLGKELLLQKREYCAEDVLHRIECVTMQDIDGILPKCLNPDNLCTVFVGRGGRVKSALNALVG